MLQVSIYRFNPETDATPQMQDYSIDTGGKDLMVLDVLELIKAEHNKKKKEKRTRQKTNGIIQGQGNRKATR